MQPHHVSSTLATWQQGFGRRRFLKGLFLGSATLAAAAAGTFAVLRRSERDALPVPAWVNGLSQHEYSLFQRALAVLLPVEGTALPAAQDLPVLQNIQTLLGYLDATTRKEVGMGLALFDNAAVFSSGCRFVDLSDEQAREYFTSWGNASVIQRTLAMVIKQLVYTAYWQEPATWGVLEFDGPVSERWGIPYLGNAPLPTSQTTSTEEAQA